MGATFETPRRFKSILELANFVIYHSKLDFSSCKRTHKEPIIFHFFAITHYQWQFNFIKVLSVFLSFQQLSLSLFEVFAREIS